jgi:predicted RNA binding protein YcfA (HicA-like mRNA interferase family)
MSQIEKIEEKLRNNPVGVKYSSLENLLMHYGFEKKQGRGSHINFRHPKLKNAKDLITIPVHGSKIKSTYVVKALDKIDKVKEIEQ